MVAGPADTAKAAPPLAPALGAMTGLQALVALAVFAPGVLAPRLGLDAQDLGVFSTAVFVIGAATTIAGGTLTRRWGSFGVAAACALAVAAAMTLATGAVAMASLVALVGAGMLLGLAFGAETPASSAVLARLARAEQRPLVFSVRQTGNQIGGMIGSVALPAIALAEPRLGLALIALLAALAAPGFLALRSRYDSATADATARAGVRQAWRLLRDAPALGALALASMPYSAMQLALNAFFVSLAVDRLGLTHVAAGLLLAIAQAGGLIGRLAWGVVATRLVAPQALIALLGVAMAACAALVALAQPDWPFEILLVLVAAFGLTASGWNGVFLAEVARLAPDGRVPEATGAVLMASYTGLVLGPVLVAAVAHVASLAASFAILALLAALATIPLIRQRA